MTDVSRTIFARSLVVLTTSAAFLLAASSFAQTSPSQPTAPATQVAPSATDGALQGGQSGPGIRHGSRSEHGARHHKQMDTDGDGAISRAEYDAAGQKMQERRVKFFEMADANKDGKLSREEMKAFRDSHRGAAHGGPHHGHGHSGQAPNPAPK